MTDVFYSSSKTPEHYTPQYILDRAKWIMGNYTDPTMPGETDGMFKEWKGSVFLNPPYGHDVWKWFGKLRDSVYQGKVKEYIVLWKCAPETKAWRILMIHTSSVAFPQKRLQFINEKGQYEKRATFPSALFYYGPSDAFFANAFYDCSIYKEMSAALKIPEEHPSTKGGDHR
jgi:hypothetical protein